MNATKAKTKKPFNTLFEKTRTGNKIIVAGWWNIRGIRMTLGKKPPIVLVTNTDKNLTDYDVLAVSGIWSVTYKGELFVTRKRNMYKGKLTKYDRTTFPHYAPAANLAKKLNAMFNCTDFAVVQLSANPC